MFNLSGLNFNFNLPTSTVPSITEQIGYTAPAQDVYVDLFGDTTAPDFGSVINTFTPNLDFSSGNLLGFQEFDMTPEQKVDYGIASQPVVAPVPQDQDITKLILQMAVGKAAADLQYDFNDDGKITSFDALQYAKQNTTPVDTQPSVGIPQDMSPAPSVDIGQRQEITSSIAPAQDTTVDLFNDTTINPIQEVAQKYQTLLEQQGGEDLAFVPDFVPTVQTPAETISMTSGEIPADLQGKLTTVGERLVSQAAQDTKNTLEQLYAEQGIQPQYTDTDGSMYAYNPLTGDYDKYYEPPSKAVQYLSAVAEAAPVAILTGGLGTNLAAVTGLSAPVASGIVNAGVSLAQGKPIDESVKAGLLSYAGGELGARATAGADLGINPFGEQAGMLADQAAGFDYFGAMTPTGAVVGDIVDTAVRTGKLDPTDLISGAVLQEHGVPEVVADAVDFTKAYTQDDYAAMLGIASDYVDLPEGAGLSFDTPEFLKEFDKEVLQPAKEILEDVGKTAYEDVIKPVGQAVADVAEPVYEDVIKPLGDTVVDVAQAIDDEVIDPFVSTVQDTIIDPLQEAGQTVYEDVIQPVGQTVADVGEAVYEAQKPVGQAIADVATDVYDALPDVTIDLPSVDLPNINLPSIDWRGLFGALLAGSQGMFSGGGGVPGTPQTAQEAIQTELLDYKPITPYRSKLSPSARLFG